MQINVSYNSSVASRAGRVQDRRRLCVKLLDAAFSNNVTLNIHVGWGEVGGQALNPTDLGESEEAGAPDYTYADIVDALNAQALLAQRFARSAGRGADLRQAFPIRPMAAASTSAWPRPRRSV